MRSNAKAKVEEMLPELLLQQLEQEYEQKISELETTHADAIAALQTQLTTTFEAGAAGARAESDATIAVLRGNIDALIRDRDELKSVLSAELQKKKTELEEADTRAMVLQTRLDGQKVESERQIARLEKKVAVGPNSWIEITFARKGCKPRTYVRRPGARFRDAVEELCRAVGKPVYGVRCVHKGKQIDPYGEGRTLLQVCLCLCFVLGRGGDADECVCSSGSRTRTRFILRRSEGGRQCHLVSSTRTYGDWDRQ